MFIQPMSVSLKDGTSAVLGPAYQADAAQMLDFTRRTSSETPFLGRCVADLECYTLEDIAAWIDQVSRDRNKCHVFCRIGNRIIGDCSIQTDPSILKSHRAELGLCVLQDFWGRGVGTVLLQTTLSLLHSNSTVRQVELGFYEGNARARGLYEKFGFRTVCVIPDALCVNGVYLNEYRMVLRL